MTLRLLPVMMLTFCAIAVPAAAQKWFMGPVVGYTAAVSVPEDVHTSSAPVRLLLGAQGAYEPSNGIQFLVGLGYRLEQVDATRVLPEGQVTLSKGGGIQVVDPGVESRTVTSTLTLGSVELQAGLRVRVLPFDSSGGGVHVMLGGMLDRVMSASIDDDYSMVQGWRGPRTVETPLESSFGAGVVMGAGVVFPVGDGRLNIDVQYVTRSTLDTSKDADGYAWLAGRGVRIGFGYLFRL